MNSTGERTATSETTLDLRCFTATVLLINGELYFTDAMLARERRTSSASLRRAEEHSAAADKLWQAGAFGDAAEFAMTAENLRRTATRTLEILDSMEQTKRENEGGPNFKEYNIEMLLPTLELYGAAYAYASRTTALGETVDLMRVAKVLLPDCAQTNLAELPALVVDELGKILCTHLRGITETPRVAIPHSDDIFPPPPGGLAPLYPAAFDPFQNREARN